MKVLLLNGSPHKEGCTYTALCEVEKTLNEAGIETEIFWIETKPLMSCTACLKCREKGECTFNKDKVNEFVKKAYDADGFIFGSPVHYAAATGAITSFLGRAFYSNSEPFTFKPAAMVCSARRRNNRNFRSAQQVHGNLTDADNHFILLEYGSRKHS